MLPVPYSVLCQLHVYGVRNTSSPELTELTQPPLLPLQADESLPATLKRCLPVKDLFSPLFGATAN